MSRRIKHKTTETGEDFKWCSHCKEWLSLVCYTKDTARWDGLQSKCRKCAAEYWKEYYATHAEEREKYRDAHAEERSRQSKEYYATHAEEARKYWLKHNFDISLDQYGAMLASQGGVCAICGRPPNGKALCVDHDHETEEIRGLLCDNCNLVLGHSRDNSSLLRAAADYIDVHLA